MVESTGGRTSSSSSTSGGKANRKCGVCGDVAKSFHFGGLACDSCKAFFRRSVQNDAHRTFACAFRRRCEITVANRKCCQHCRFRRCLAIGMETGWVMTEEERMDMLRSRMEKKRGAVQKQGSKKRRKMEEVCDGRSSGLMRTDLGAGNGVEEVHEGPPRPPPPPSRDVRAEIDGLTRTLASFLGDEKMDDGRLQEEDEEEPKWVLVLLFVISVQKLVRFALGVGRFQALRPRDQADLLRANAFEMYLAVHFYGCASCLYPETPSRDGVHGCHLLTSVEEASPCNGRFSALVRDAPTLALLLAVVLFCPASGADPASEGPIEAHRMHFCRLLQRHLVARWGASGGARLFPEILLLLPALREVRDKRLFSRLDVDRSDLDVATTTTIRK